MEHKKILILGSYAPSLFNFRGPLIRDLVGAGHDVSVGAPHVDADLRRKIEALGATVNETPLDRNGSGIMSDLRYFFTLLRLIWQKNPDLIITYTIKPNIWGSFAAAAKKIPTYALVTGLGYAFSDDSIHEDLKTRVAKKVSKYLYRASTDRNRRVMFQNPDDLNDFVEAGCLRDISKASLISGSGVDMVHYRRTNLPDTKVVLMISRLLRAKGVADFARAAIFVRNIHPDARFLLVGPFDPGPDSVTRSELDEWIAGGLEYLGAMDDVRVALNQARIFVLPSYREGTPRSTLEAMAMGRPVVTTDAPGCRETVEDGVNGILVPVRDPTSLAGAIMRLLSDFDQAVCMGEAGFKLVAKKFDVRLVNRQIMEVIGLPYTNIDVAAVEWLK